MRRALLLAAVLVAFTAAPATAYQHFSMPTTAGGVEPERWQSLPIALTVDNGPTDISSEIATAVAAWNNVPLAQDPWGTLTKAVDGTGNAVDFNGANFGTAWGNLTGDGKQEVVFDEDGSGLRALGLAPSAVNGLGDRSEVIVNGNAAIDDMFLIINGSKTDFDRQSTEVHELGHTLGLAHSSVGFSEGRDGALSPVLISEEPTMFPYAVPGDARRTLEADDIASLESLYPDNPAFSSSTGTLTGTVTRCGTGEPVLGANVRAINVANPTVQITGVTGFDGQTDGTYKIEGVPPGEYKVVVEPLAGDPDYLDRLAMYTRVDTDFTAEYFNSTEGDCAQDDDPTAFDNVQVGAAGTKTADFQVEGASLALVIDRTGSMGPEIGAIKTGLDTMIDQLSAAGASLPKTAIVTFDDNATVDVVSRDPQKLRHAIDVISLHSTPDCPEGSNSALMAAGRLLGTGGRAILVTDADSHRTGPSRQAVDDLYASKGARLTVLLSGSCPPDQNPPRAAARAAAPAVVATPGDPNDPGPDENRPVDALGVENAIRTFSEESLLSGGLFSFQPQIKSNTAEANERYSDTLANVALSAVHPAVAAIDPSPLPRGTTLDVELTGSNTNFRAGSTVAVAGGGVTVTAAHVLSPTRIEATLQVAPGAALGFRNVTVGTDRGDGSIETAPGLGAVEVVAPPSSPTILSVAPSVGAVGTTEDVTISGALTHFTAGTSGAAFGAGVTVNHLTVLSPTSAVANVTVQPGAEVGFRDVNVLTGAENAGEGVPGPFLVTAAPPAVPRLTSASPRSGARGATVDVSLAGSHTAFTPGTSVASVSGTGVQVLSTTVTNATHAVARLRIASDAPLGFRDLGVTTGAQDAALLDAFEVMPAPRPEPTPTPTPSPTPRPTPTPTPTPTPCSDAAPPHASFRSARSKHRHVLLKGRAGDAGCASSGVSRVQVAISRKAHGGKCRFVARSGRLTGARRCAKPVWLKAKGTTQWSFKAKRRLPRATYTLRARARDAAGNVQARPAKRTLRVR